MLADVDLKPISHETFGTTQTVLILSGTAPGEPGVGGLILRDLVETVGVECCQCCWLAPRHASHESYLPGLITTIQPRRYETGFRPTRGLIGEVISAVAMRLLRPRMLRNASHAVERMIDQFRPRFLLAVLESPAAIQVALAVHQRTRIPIRVIVWDDVDLFCQQGMLDRWTRRWIQQSFQRVLQASERVAVICENMQRDYRERYGVDSLIMRHGVPLSNSHVTTRDQTTRNCAKIGFAGSITAPDCMRGLVEALDSVGWQIDGRDVVLRLLGARYLLDSRKPQRIEYFGWRSVMETRERLAECDLLYLPQTFAADLRRFSELSFPTKLSTYVAAHRPIFLHAPNYGSLTGFWERCVLGPLCHELAPAAILGTLRHALADNPGQQQVWQQQIVAAHQVFSPSQFQETVRRLIE